MSNKNGSHLDLTNPAVVRSAEIVGKALKENSPHVKFQLSVIRALTDDRFMAKILNQTYELKKADDLPMTDDGSRKRTVGGTFFKLAKDGMTGMQRYRYFRITRGKKDPESESETEEKCKTK